jgi:signal transduction histidine kinase
VASLAAIKLNLSAIGKALPDPSGIGASIMAETGTLLSETIEQIRDLCTDLRPAVLDQQGLIAATESRAREFSERTGIHVRVLYDEFERRFASEVESTLFHIAQEALRNCVRHAKARNVEILFEQSEDRVELRIVDDGIGFDVDRPVAAGSSNGLGLPAMRERAEAVGAQFEIASSPGRGTRIRVSLDSARAFSPPA